MGKLDGKVALITGAARGQGESHARLFVEEGARVAVTDVLDEQGEKVAADLGGDAIWCHLDVSSAADWTAAVSRTVSAFGKLNVLINNAGIWPFGTIEEMPEETFMRTVSVNQLGTWLGIKSVIEPMRAAGGGSIVNTASIAGLIGMPGLGAYVGSKHAIRGISKTAAAELGHDGIRVNSVYPGAIVGDQLPDGVGEEQLETMFAHLPVPRAGRVGDVSAVMLFLASDDSAYCTGTEIVVDGGSLVTRSGGPSGARPPAAAS
jgi:3alpha(or 20beta)-hydroxysteroid dehydrogenase